MSSAWTIVSPSHVSVGPGGCFDELTSAVNRARVSAGELPLSVAMSFDCMLLRLNPDVIILPKNCGGLIFAVAVMWASTSRTVQSVHSDAVAHCSSVSASRSAANALRSEWIVGHTSDFAIWSSLFS
jgi:hypothetical protein